MQIQSKYLFTANKNSRYYEKRNSKEYKMNIFALISFAIAAVLGVILVAMYSKGQLTINGALLHGLFAVIGVVLLIISVVQGKTTRIDNYALILFIIAALGGLVLISSHLTKGKLPQAIIGIHAIVAVIAFLMLLSGNVGR
jgi:peptidoglycan/LPS O-acetylase OafA/YrhL